MRILRIRRGFTTNSSGADEFLPTVIPDGGMHVRVQPEGLDASTPSRAADAGRPTIATQKVDGAPAARPSLGNALVIGLVVVCVCLLFAVELTVRFFLRRRKERRDDA